MFNFMRMGSDIDMKNRLVGYVTYYEGVHSVVTYLFKKEILGVKMSEDMVSNLSQQYIKGS